MTRERYLSDPELEAFMRAVRERRHVHQPRDHALFALLANTGIRPSEALALTRADLHLGGAEPWMRVRRERRPHAAPPVTELVLNRNVAKVLRRHAKGMPRGARVFPMTKRQSERLFHYYRRRAGIVHGCKLYGLRHTAGMRMVRHTRDLRLIQAVMGHQRLRATAVYLQSDPNTLRRAFATVGTAV